MHSCDSTKRGRFPKMAVVVMKSCLSRAVDHQTQGQIRFLNVSIFQVTPSHLTLHHVSNCAKENEASLQALFAPTSLLKTYRRSTDPYQKPAEPTAKLCFRDEAR